MAATLAQLRTRAQRRADMENSSFITSPEWLDYINEGLGKLHELLVETFEDYEVTSTSVTLVAGTETYALPADFFKERGVDYVEGSTRYTLDPFEFAERNDMEILAGASGFATAYRYAIVGANLRVSPKPTAAGTLTLWYVPQVTLLAADGDTLPTRYSLAWERYIVLYAAIQGLDKEESDTSKLEARLEREERKIASAASTRRAGAPRRVVDVRYGGQRSRGR
jgi:hypothetical protein